jgi:hypothetical protein
MRPRLRYIQIHKKSSYTLASIFGVEIIIEGIKVRFILLSSFIVENLKTLSMLYKFMKQQQKE